MFIFCGSDVNKYCNNSICVRKINKEELNRWRRKESRLRKRVDYEPAIPDELENQQWKHSNKEVTFRGQKLPSHFEVYASETQKLTEGQVIGKTRFGQKLYWIGNSVVAKG